MPEQLAIVPVDHDPGVGPAGAGTWARLLAAHVDRSAGRRRGVPDHRPSAAILACSDARVPPSVIFDQPAGELFVVRIAGNSASAEAVASLTYAVEVLGVDTIVVLGHTHCGAVAAAAAGSCTGALAPIVEPICRLAIDHPQLDPIALGELHVRRTVRALAVGAGPFAAAIRRGELSVVGAVHDLEEGRISMLETAPATINPDTSERTVSSTIPHLSEAS